MKERQGLITLSLRRPDLFAALAGSVAHSVAVPPEARLLVNQDPADAVTTRAALDAGWEVWAPGTNLSYAEGHNRAVEQVDATHYVLLNNDVTVEPTTLAKLWAHRAAPIVGVVIRHPVDGRVTHGGGGLDRRLLPYHLDRDVPYRKRDGSRPCWWATFACVQIRADAWAQLGGLDPQFWYGYEDLDFCLRAVEAGMKPRVAMGAEAWHAEMGTRRASGDDRNLQAWLTKWRTRLPVLHERRDLDFAHEAGK